jgi:GT2 family glycosyltransferase
MVSICILTYNRCGRLRELLKELSRLSHRPLEIIVVDNNSQDETPAMLRTEFASVRHLRTERNIGIAARNLGLQNAKGDFIVTLDDDITGLSDRAIEVLVSAFRSNPKLGAINFQVVTVDGRVCNWVHHCKEEEFSSKVFMTYEITEGAVAFRKKALEASGLYPEGFFLSHEGPDLAFRILDSGFSVIYSGEISVVHHFADEGRKVGRNYYYDTRNLFWLAARNFPAGYAMRYLARTMPAMLVYSLRDGFFVNWLRAVADGVGGLGKAMAERRRLSKSTMRIIREIDSRRPSITYLIKKRVLARDGLLFK